MEVATNAEVITWLDSALATHSPSGEVLDQQARLEVLEVYVTGLTYLLLRGIPYLSLHVVRVLDHNAALFSTPGPLCGIGASPAVLRGTGPRIVRTEVG